MLHRYQVDRMVESSPKHAPHFIIFYGCDISVLFLITKPGLSFGVSLRHRVVSHICDIRAILPMQEILEYMSLDIFL